MTTTADVIAALNEALTAELTAVKIGRAHV